MFISRRSFLAVGSGAIGSGLLGCLQAVPQSPGPFDPAFGTATEALSALRRGEISSRELVDLVFARIERYDSKVNAFVTLNQDEARAVAARADSALVAGSNIGALHGLPILVKDSFETAGLRTTSGSRSLEKHVPRRDAVAVRRLREAGAVILGKTSLPEFASDLQCYNEVAGTTRNPWDGNRTPGGSTGGGAAALAAGFGFLELGSDIGGSIRTPSHFCGVFGHKPSLHVVPLEGHIPPLPDETPVKDNLGVAGPLARSAQDLSLELQVIGGPEPGRGYNWSPPPPRGNRLKDYRIGFVLDDPFCPVSSEVSPLLEGLIDELDRLGVQLREGWPEGFRPDESFETYLRLLGAAFSSALTQEDRELLRNSSGKPWERDARLWLAGAEGTHAAWRSDTARQFRERDRWQEYFRNFDAFLLPENFLAAFRHDQEKSFFERTVSTPEGPRQYGDMMRWISPATLTGCPATVAPIGRTAANLPVGIQIMGPFLEDFSPIQIAGLITDVTGGFVPPPGFGEP